jgi:hypothetical protein
MLGQVRSRYFSKCQVKSGKARLGQVMSGEVK